MFPGGIYLIYQAVDGLSFNTPKLRAAAGIILLIISPYLVQPWENVKAPLILIVFP